MQNESLISRHRAGFGSGYTSICCEGERGLETGMDFGIHIMPRGEVVVERDAKESVWVLLQGRAEVVLEGNAEDNLESNLEGKVEGNGDAASPSDIALQTSVVERHSLFDEAPTALHVAAKTQVCITALSERVEWAVARATNPQSFTPRLFVPEELEPEYRGAGLAQGTCLRNVRLIFDRAQRPKSNLVVGEVINYPGRWSSYPPHHHAQPEIYHYRFSQPQGYGHGEVGERVFKVRQYDTLRIPGMQDHAQAAAPGYGMYYLWIVRHLDNRPYDGFEFTPEHTWMLDPAAKVWEPKPMHSNGQCAGMNLETER